MGLSLDITERKGMELQLSESQTLFAGIDPSTSGHEKLAAELVSISRLDDFPAEANVDRQTCIEKGYSALGGSHNRVLTLFTSAQAR